MIRDSDGKNPKYLKKQLCNYYSQRAKEDLERKAMEKARNEYNYEQYMKKKERAEAKARNKIRRQNSKGPTIFLIVILLICLYVYLYQNGINILEVIQSIYANWTR